MHLSGSNLTPVVTVTAKSLLKFAPNTESSMLNIQVRLKQHNPIGATIMDTLAKPKAAAELQLLLNTPASSLGRVSRFALATNLLKL